MKKYGSILNHFLFITVLLSLYSCQNFHFDAAWNSTHRTYNGDSYSNAYKDKARHSFALAMHWIGGHLDNEYGENSINNNLYPYSDLPVMQDSYTAPANSFMSNVYLLSGLEFIQKNSKDGDTKLNLSYLKVPAMALYSHPLNNKGKILGGLGPYFAYGIGGKIKDPGNIIKAFDKDNGFKGLMLAYPLQRGINFPIACLYG